MISVHDFHRKREIPVRGRKLVSIHSENCPHAKKNGNPREGKKILDSAFREIITYNRKREIPVRGRKQ